MVFDIITTYISQLNLPIITSVAKLFDNDFVFLAIILILTFFAEQGKKRNRLILTIGFIFLAGTGIKYLVHEPRPCTVVPAKIGCPSSYSFPSSHSVVAFALAIALWKKPNGWIYTAFASFVAFTRIYLGVHTLFDVFGGTVVGVLGYLITDAVWKKLPMEIKTPFSNFLG